VDTGIAGVLKVGLSGLLCSEIGEKREEAGEVSECRRFLTMHVRICHHHSHPNLVCGDKLCKEALWTHQSLRHDERPRNLETHGHFPSEF